MRSYRLIPLLFLFTVTFTNFAAPCAISAEPEVGSIEYQRDIPYAKIGDRTLSLDMARKIREDDDPRPALVFIHGGGWRNGNKSRGLPMLLPLIAGGEYVGFSVEYRLTGEAAFPAQIYDCKAAIRWIRRHADRLGVDPDRIGVWGISAGGHLVSLLGTSGDVESVEGDVQEIVEPSDGEPAEVSSRVTCVVDFCGPSDFMLYHPGHPMSSPKGGVLHGLFGGPMSEHIEAVRLASPVTHITKDDPPFLILHGTEDRLVRLSHPQRLQERLTAAGVGSTFIRIEGGGHVCINKEVYARIRTFFARILLDLEHPLSPNPIVWKR